MSLHVDRIRLRDGLPILRGNHAFPGETVIGDIHTTRKEQHASAIEAIPDQSMIDESNEKPAFLHIQLIMIIVQTHSKAV